MEHCPWKGKGEELPIKIWSVLHELMEANKFLGLAFLVWLPKEDRLTIKLCFFISEAKATNFYKQDFELPFHKKHI